MQFADVVFLTPAERPGIKTVVPARRIPVINVEAKRNYFSSAGIGLLSQLPEQLIGRRTTGAALRSKEFHDD
jgi:hypothetical protein